MTQATLLNAFLIGGGVLVAGGVLMILLAPDPVAEESAFVVEPTPNGLRVRF